MRLAVPTGAQDVKGIRQDPGPAQRQHLTGHPCLERLAHFFPLLVFVEKGGGCRNPIGPRRRDVDTRRIRQSWLDGLRTGVSIMIKFPEVSRNSHAIFFYLLES